MKKITIVGSPELFHNQTDIYSGQESIRFNDRHPIFRTLMKIEFEEVLRNYRKIILKD
ncbi:MAG: hypothetical protein HWN79_10145 [Candidatus Lokiarchaeota archaeon]|nr:hypothetical protein [Candidatus Lokiarchaeota archaeon]